MLWRILVHGLLNGAIRPSTRASHVPRSKGPSSTHGPRRPEGPKSLITVRAPNIHFSKAFDKVLHPNPRPLSINQGHNDAREDEWDWIVYKIKPGDTLWELAVKRFHVKVEDLIKDNRIRDPRRLMPGQRILIRRPRYGGVKDVVASWYGRRYHGRPMANGEPFNMYAPTIAHKSLPLGTKVELENPETGAKVVATVTDRGPFIDGRDIDLSYGLARRLSLVEKGVGRLKMRVLG